jgi:CubicO group peptidase (beta-lactamase class C family)
MQKIIDLSQKLVANSDCDAVAMAIIDFNKNDFVFFENLDGEVETKKSQIYFDYASLTKPLMNSFTYLNEKMDDQDLLLLLNHSAGLPAWGLLPKSNWKEQILSYPIKESETLYSDFSALRYMLEVENKTGLKFRDLVFKNLDPAIKFWTELDGSELCLQNGFYHQKPNVGKVHDPNSFNLACFTNHAGLFGTVEALAKTLLEFNSRVNLSEKVRKKMEEENHSKRFVFGFDTVSNPMETLAGEGCSKYTFGHLGFTGTSFWIDAEKGLGHIILSNSTKYYWFNKQLLNSFRKEAGRLTWHTTSL